MKKLKKILVVLTVVLMTVCTASINVFADETEEPVVTPADTLRHDGEFEIDQNKKTGDTKDIKDYKTDEIEVDVDLNHKDLDDPRLGDLEDVEIFTVGELEQDIDAPKHDRDGKDTDSSNPVDILIYVTCELDEEVKNVVASAIDKMPYDKEALTVTDNEDGTYLIETPEINYNLVRKNGKWYLKNITNDYDEIEIDVTTQELSLNWIIQDGNGLKLEEDEFDLVIDKKGNSTEAIIFDGDDVKNFTESWTNFFGTFNVYDFAYNEGAEGLTFKNIQYVVTTLDGDDASEDVKVEYDPVTGEVKVSALKEGKYTVYLQGYYTEKLYEDRPEVVKKVDEIAGNLVNYTDKADENAKVEYEVPNWSKNKRDKNGDVYSFTYNMTTNEAWATFAKVQVNVALLRPDKTVVSATTADGLVNLIVDEETETKGHGRRETVVADGKTQNKINKNAIRQGETVVGYFDIDATKQGVDEEGNILPTVEEVHELTEGVQVTVRIDAKFVKTEDGKLTDFNVYSRHNGETYSYDVDGVEPIYRHGHIVGYNVTFTADKFSTFAIAYHNYTPYYPPTEYKVLNTGVRA